MNELVEKETNLTRILSQRSCKITETPKGTKRQREKIIEEEQENIPQNFVQDETLRQITPTPGRSSYKQYGQHSKSTSEPDNNHQHGILPDLRENDKKSLAKKGHNLNNSKSILKSAKKSSLKKHPVLELQSAQDKPFLNHFPAKQKVSFQDTPKSAYKFSKLPGSNIFNPPSSLKKRTDQIVMPVFKSAYKNNTSRNETLRNVTETWSVKSNSTTSKSAKRSQSQSILHPVASVSKRPKEKFQNTSQLNTSFNRKKLKNSLSKSIETQIPRSSSQATIASKRLLRSSSQTLQTLSETALNITSNNSSLRTTSNSCNNPIRNSVTPAPSVTISSFSETALLGNSLSSSLTSGNKSERSNGADAVTESDMINIELTPHPSRSTSMVLRSQRTVLKENIPVALNLTPKSQLNIRKSCEETRSENAPIAKNDENILQTLENGSSENLLSNNFENVVSVAGSSKSQQKCSFSKSEGEKVQNSDSSDNSLLTDEEVAENDIDIDDTSASLELKMPELPSKLPLFSVSMDQSESESSEDDDQGQKQLSRKKKPSVKKSARRPTSSSRYEIFTEAGLRRIVKRFYPYSVSSSACEAIQECTSEFLHTMKEFLKKSSAAKKRKIINVNDVELFIRRHNLCGHETLEAIVENNLPLELRQELIPIATSHNVIVPSKKRDG